MDLLPFQRWDAGREHPTSSLLFQSCTYKIPEVAGSQVHIVGRYFSFQGKSFVRSEPWGYDQMLSWGNQREKTQRRAFAIAKTSDTILKMSKYFKLPALSGKCFKPHVCISLSVLISSYPNH